MKKNNFLILTFLVLMIFSCQKEELLDTTNTTFLLGKWNSSDKRFENKSILFSKIKNKDSIFKVHYIENDIELFNDNLKLNKDKTLGNKEFIIKNNKFYIILGKTILIELNKVN